MPFDTQVVDVIIQFVCDAINRGSAGIKECELVRRDTMFRLAEVLPLLNRQIRDAVLNDARFPCLIFYERCRLFKTFDKSFLEGVPIFLTLFVGHLPTAAELPQNALVSMSEIEVVADRAVTVYELERRDNSRDFLNHIDRLRVEDLPSGVPLRAHALVARMRSVAQGLRLNRPADFFKQCGNDECGRLSFVGSPRQATQGELSYWDLLAGDTASPISCNSFCCSTCYAQFQRQLNEAMPPFKLDEDDLICVTGRSRVVECFRRALKRNRLVARHIRLVKKNSSKYTAISTYFDVMVKRYVKILNIDAGFLYAAAQIAESPALSANKVLPGSAKGWRNRPVFWASSIRTVQKIFEKSNVSDSILYNLSLDEPYFDHLRRVAGRLF